MLFRVVKNENLEDFKGFTVDQKYIADSFTNPALNLKRELILHERDENQTRLECKISNKMYNTSIIAVFVNGLFAGLFIKNNVSGYTSPMMYAEFLDGAKKFVDQTLKTHNDLDNEFIGLLNH